MGFCTSGSAAKTVALNPGGSRIFAAASLAGIGFDLSGSELYGAGNSEALRLSDMISNNSGVFIDAASRLRECLLGSCIDNARRFDPVNSSRPELCISQNTHLPVSALPPLVALPKAR